MLKKIIPSGLLILLFSCSTLLKAAESVGYETLSPAQPTNNPAKVEVIEFFWYGCPHCYDFEPLLAKWVKSQPANVEFIRQPAVFSSLWGKHAKAYFTAEALGVVDKVHNDFFEAIQVKKQKLEDEDQLAKFFAEHGVDEEQFRTAYNSFLVDTKMRQAGAIAARYGITGVPAIVINGKYKTNGPLAGSHQKMIEVMDQLVKQESANLSK
ncbi:thiol:disulfide interchange protein DsbA/DsbL [Methylobacter sp. YRD-M1]|uniref:thiol:disulfide interchange protein DsbA/DsbL n=1 Tax=Methylobacter sp. YRD-M1 TaxID=2911520 RepID=UPI00227A801E|nr:thiol:disulfide interchange protein DsbA/DsbL [Methylobacter sp. YRD-M1]WAK02079.1 thiol:disulfide interchange protein DsbA/DsbL [Methylobacter sp. YRD-M1]